MNNAAGPFIGLALLAAVAAGVYAYNLRGELAQAKASLAAATQTVASAKQMADDATRKIAITNSSIDTCIAQLKDTQDRLDSMLRPSRRKAQ